MQLRRGHVARRFKQVERASEQQTGISFECMLKPPEMSNPSREAMSSEEEAPAVATAAAASSTPPAVQGAKRRKPLKTTRVAQRDDSEERPISPARSPLEDLERNATSPPLLDESGPRSSESPPLPTPVISSTTVVTSLGDQSYKCPLCHITQPSQKDFTTHIRCHNEAKPHTDPNDPTGQAKVYYCCLCGKMLSSFSSLDRHMLVHSGERPFSCELCGQTFTTNGNMHRHKRTHSAKELQEFSEAMNAAAAASGANTAGSGATALGRRGGRKRKTGSAAAAGAQIEGQSSAAETVPAKRPHQARCPVCGDTFFTENMLENHVRERHAGQELKCDQCSFSYANYSTLRIHKLFHSGGLGAAAVLNSSPDSLLSTSTVHSGVLCSSLSAPLELSSHAFPSLAQPFLLQQQPDKHPNGKPASAFHEKASPKSCDSVKSCESGVLSRSVHDGPEAGLCDSDSSNKDLADVQSILSITNGGNVLNGKQRGNSKDSVDVDQEEEDNERDYQEEEEEELQLRTDNPSTIGFQDDHDPAIKDMKLKGEFPCRLCPAVYPNLRALKGHNKEHLNKAPYCCNVGTCTYSSSDKSTLTRHMRTHTGEKPYECKLCSYGFTTKANCERHLKNKHGKTRRDDIRDSLIVHEGDDVDGQSSNGAPRAGAVLGLLAQSSPQRGTFRCKVCKQLFATSAKVVEHAVREHPAYSNDADHIFEEVKQGASRSNIESILEGDFSVPSMVPRIAPFPSLATLKPLARDNGDPSISPAASSHSSHASDDTPLDLSRPGKALKDRSSPQLPNLAGLTMPTSEDLLKSNAMVMGLFPQFVFPPALLAARPTLPQAPFPFPFPPFVPTALNFLPGMESLQRLQQQQQQQAAALSAAAAATASTAAAESLLRKHPSLGGAPPPSATETVNAASCAAANGETTAKATSPAPAAGHLHQMKAQHIGAAAMSAQQEMLLLRVKKEQQQMLKEKREQEEAAEALQSLNATVPIVNGRKRPLASLDGDEVVTTEGDESNEGDLGRANRDSDSESNYKLVIKNGVLMKKQKQRRYRTERPYGCDFCTARFTLRSNMERHVKQQHPEHWSSRPRGSRRSHSATAPVLAPQFRDLEAANGAQLSKAQAEDEAEEDADSEEAPEEDNSLVIDETKDRSDEDQGGVDLASVNRMLSTASSHCFPKLYDNDDAKDAHVKGKLETDEDNSDDPEGFEVGEEEEEEEEEGALSGCDEDGNPERKMSAYSAAPHKIKCPHCDRKFPWKSSLNRHILTHTGDKPYKCRSCPLWFTTKSNCERHQVRKHGGINYNNNNNDSGDVTPDPLFSCSFCPSSSFTSEQNLHDHNSVHHPEKNLKSLSEIQSARPGSFMCHLCRACFEFRPLAIEHIRLNHSFDYEELSKSFYTDLNTDENEEIGSGAAKKCLFCPETSDSECAMLEHVTKHVTGGGQESSKTYSCDICYKRFPLKSSMVSHRKKAHDTSSNEEDEPEENDDERKVPALKIRFGASVARSKRPGLMDMVSKLQSTATKHSAQESAIDEGQIAESAERP